MKQSLDISRTNSEQYSYRWPLPDVAEQSSGRLSPALQGAAIEMSGPRLATRLISLSLAVGLASCDRAEHPVARPPALGMEKSPTLVFEELTKMGYCVEQEAPTACLSNAVGIDSIGVDVKDGRIETVEVLVNLGKHHEARFVDAANENLSRLTRYFAPPWKERGQWIAKAVDNSRRAYCPMMVNISQFSIIVVRLTPQTLVGDYENLYITRPRSVYDKIRPYDYDTECNYSTGRFKKEKDNPPYLPYTD
jgi:hypothetical protein